MKIVWRSCAACDFSRLERLPRTFWMRLLPPLRHYHCPECNASVLAPKKRVDSQRWAANMLRGLHVAPGAQRAAD